MTKMNWNLFLLPWFLISEVSETISWIHQHELLLCIIYEFKLSNLFWDSESLSIKESVILNRNLILAPKNIVTLVIKKKD
jgi:hypothetical protein